MNKKLLLSVAAVILLACNFLFPAKSVPTSNEPAATHLSSSVTAPASEPASNSTQTTATPTTESETVTLPGFTITRLHKKDGELQSMLAEEAQKAIALGLMPVVEFDATWCPPCQQIDAAIATRNDLMFDAYEGTYIIKLDVDEWSWDGGGVQNFRFEGIPVYFKLDESGYQTGEVIDGGAWGEDIPENIAPVMDEFLHGG
jgi:thiol-disulfide isomerase/thioredoxin